MKRLGKAHGYTIIETMLFLVITGVLLASAMLIFNGRQQRTQFTQGVREIDSQIRGIMNEAASGYYPNKGGISCSSSGGGGPNPTNATTDQGKNEGCIFLGRVLQFSETDSYIAYTVVGQQVGADGRTVTTLGSTPNSARQTLLTPSDSQPNYPEANATYELPWGITVEKVVAPEASALPIGAFGFISTLGSFNATGSDLVSGSSSTSLMPLLNTNRLTNVPPSLSGAQPAVNATQALEDSGRNSSQVILCLRSGGGDRQAAIVIGANNNSVGTEVQIDSVPEACNA